VALSYTSICNQALSKIGAKEISNIDSDSSSSATKCRVVYESVRDSLLRLIDWNFAIERQELSQLATTPTYEFSYYYALPTDPYCLRVIETEDDSIYTVEGRKLLSDETSCNIKYIARVENPINFDSNFVTLYIDALASTLAITIANSGTLKDRMDEDYRISLAKARETNALEFYDDDLDQNTTSLWDEAGR